MNKQLSIFRPFEDLTSDFFGIANAFERDINDMYKISGHYLRVLVDTKDDDYIIKAEVPGIKQDDIDISFDNNMITITAEYKEEGDHVFRNGKYSRSFRLTDIDAAKAEAELKDGILTVKLPKAEEKKARKIKIATK